MNASFKYLILELSHNLGQIIRGDFFACVYSFMRFSPLHHQNLFTILLPIVLILKISQAKVIGNIQIQPNNHLRWSIFISSSLHLTKIKTVLMWPGMWSRLKKKLRWIRANDFNSIIKALKSKEFFNLAMSWLQGGITSNVLLFFPMIQDALNQTI